MEMRAWCRARLLEGLSSLFVRIRIRSRSERQAVFSDDKEQYNNALAHLERAESHTLEFTSQYKRDRVRNTFASFVSAGRDQVQLLRMTEVLCAMAEIALGKSLLYFQKQNYLKGPYYFRKAYRWFDRAHRAMQQLEAQSIRVCDEVRGDIMFGLGFFHFVVSLIPSHFQWFLTWLGFTSDRAASYDQLRISVSLHCPRRINAALLLMWFLQLLDLDRPAVDRVVDQLNEIASNSILVAFSLGYLKSIQGDLESSNVYFNSCANLADDSLETVKLACVYFRGTNAWCSGEWEQCARDTEQFLNEAKTIYFKAFGHYRLAFAKWMLGQREQSLPLLDRVSEFAKANYEHDQYALCLVDKFRRFERFTPFDEVYVALHEMLEARQFDAAGAMLARCETLLEDYNGFESIEWCRALFHYCTGIRLAGLGDHRRAIGYLQEHVLPFESLLASSEEFYAIPYSLVTIAESLLVLGDGAQAGAYIARAKGCREYFFKKYLHYRIFRAEFAIAKLNSPSPLLALAPAPAGNVVDHAHLYKAAYFSKPTWCTACSKFIREVIGKQGYVCELPGCTLKIHKACLPKDAVPK
jgi:hypothetical protein